MEPTTLEIACILARFEERALSGGSTEALAAAIHILWSVYPHLQQRDVARTAFIATAHHLDDLPRC